MENAAANSEDGVSASEQPNALNEGSSGDATKDSDARTKAPAAASSNEDLLLSMLESDIVTQVDKSLVKKSKKFSKKDKAKIAEMVKGLSKFREGDDDSADFHVSHKMEMKAPKSPKSPSKTDELAVLPENLDSKEERIVQLTFEDGIKNLKIKEKSDTLPISQETKSKGTMSKKAKKKAAKLLQQAQQNPVTNTEADVPTQVDHPEVTDTGELESKFTDLKIAQAESPSGQEKGEKKKAQKRKLQKESVEARLRATNVAVFEGNDREQGARPKGGKVGSYTQLLSNMGEGKATIHGSQNQRPLKTPDRQLSPKICVTLPEFSGGGKDGGKERRIITIHRSDQDKPAKGSAGKKKGHEDHVVEQQQTSGKKKKNKKGEEKVSVAERLQSAKKKQDRLSESSDSLDSYRAVSRSSVGSDKLDSSQSVGRAVGQQTPMFQTMPIPQTDTVMQVHVPKAEHKYITGPGYSHIREIYNITGVSIEVPPPNSGSEMVVMRGDRLQAGAAVALMFSKSNTAQAMDNQYPSGTSPLPTPLLASHGQGKGQGHVRGQGQQYQSQKGKKGHQRDVNRKGSNDSGNAMSQSYVFNNQMYKRGVSDPNMERGHGQYGKGKGQGRKTPDRDGAHGHAGNSAQKGQGKRSRKNKVVFADYIPAEELSHGLKRGLLVQGPIRINPRNFEEAYVPHPDGRSDILICGLKERNRAMNGDIVAVELNQEGDWKMTHVDLKELEDEHTKAHEADDSDPEVVIEAEETVEVINSSQKQLLHDSQDTKSPAGSTKTDTATTPGQSPKKKSCARVDHSRKRFTSLNEVLQHGSPVSKKIFEGDDAEARKLLQRTGKVVSIIECKHSRACTGFIKPFPDKNTNVVLFSPSDHRVPRLKIPTEDCPQDFLERPEDHAKTLYVARIVDWKQDSMYAEGHLAKSLGEAGEIEPETEGMLIENGIDFDDFPADALACLPSDLPWSIPLEELERRRDFRSSCVFTIDPATARDLDDALSCEDLGDGRYRVGVHIADVSYFVSEGTVLDKVAAFRSTSVYLVHKVIPMLPRLLCEQLCSLNPDEDRLTFSVEWVISEEGEIEDEWFGRSVIRSCSKLSYDHAQGFISQPDREWTTDELPPISEGFTVEDMKTRVLNMQKIAKNLRKKRFDGGALRLDQVKLQFSLDKESGLPNGYSVYEQRDSNRLVEEFMLLANMAVAHKINQDFPDKAVLRRHPPPQEKMVDNLKELCSALGIHLDVSSAGEFQRTLWRYCGDDEYSQARMQVLVALCSKPMQNAKYFCTGCIDDESLYRHYALNVPLYTHFTSPIRRYPDVMVHRLLGAALDYSPEPSREPREIHQLAEHCNDKKTAAKRVGDLSAELFFAVFVKTAGPLEEKAMVMSVLDKAFDIFVLRLGVSKRVYCDKLNIMAKTFRKDKKVPSLTLVWAVEEGEPSLEQEITIFSVVDCVLQQGDLPLQWTAVIKKPERQAFQFVPVMNLCQAIADDAKGEGDDDGTEHVTGETEVSGAETDDMTGLNVEHVTDSRTATDQQDSADKEQHRKTRDDAETDVVAEQTETVSSAGEDVSKTVVTDDVTESSSEQKEISAEPSGAEGLCSKEIDGKENVTGKGESGSEIVTVGEKESPAEGNGEDTNEKNVPSVS